MNGLMKSFHSVSCHTLENISISKCRLPVLNVKEKSTFKKY